MENNTFEEIWNEIKKAKRILMTLHYRPDGDSLGSSTAMKYVLEKEGKKVKLVSKDDLSENLKAYSFSNEVEFGKDIQKENLDDFDLIIFLDYPLYDVSEDFMNRLKSKRVINIDHHETNSYFGNLNYVNPKMPSCCSVLTEMFQQKGVDFDRELSLRLMVGICTDTVFFLHGNTVDTLKKATFLLEKGKLNYEKDLFTPIMSSPWNMKKLWGIVLTNMQRTTIDGKVVGYGWAKKEEYEEQGLNAAEIRLAVACMQDIKGLDLIFVLTELDGHIKGSFRSKEFDTTIYSTEFGGGGHKGASAFIIENEGMEKAVQKVLDKIEEKGFVLAD